MWTCLQICKEASVLERIMRGNIPSNLFKGDVVEAPQHFFFHLIEGPRTASNTESKLCCTPVLLDEVQLAMVFGIVITQMST